MLVYFNKVKLDRTSFLLTKRLAWASVTRTERVIKDNFSRFLLKRILPRVGRFLVSSYGKSVSSFNRSFRQGEVSILLSSRIRPHSHAWEHFYVALPKNAEITLLQEFCHISVGTLAHIRESTCCTLKERKIRHLQIFEVGTEEHIAWLLGYWPNSHQTAKRLCSLPGPLSTTEPPPPPTPTGYSILAMA